MEAQLPSSSAAATVRNALADYFLNQLCITSTLLCSVMYIYNLLIKKQYTNEVTIVVIVVNSQ